MKNLSLRFVTSIFAGLLWVFVLVNFLGWSGMDLGGAFGVNSNPIFWNNRYFGFSSFLDSLQLIDAYQGISIGAYELASPSSLFDTLKRFASCLLLNIPETIDSAIKLVQAIRSGADLFKVALNIYTLLVNYVGCYLNLLYAIAYALYFVFQVVTYLAGFLGYIGALLVGTFNKPMADLSDLYGQWSSYIIS